MGEIVVLDNVTSLNIPPERVLQAAIEAEVASVVVVAQLADGEEYFASSVASGPEVLWMLERAKLKLLNIPDDPPQCLLDYAKTPPDDAPGGVVLDFPKPDAPFWGS